jgi:hypothetical protein
MDLVASLSKLAGSPAKATVLLESTAAALGVKADASDRALVAMALCGQGVPPEEASKSLRWQEFEGFCSKLFRVAGYVVRENVRLRKPRVQIDLVAVGPVYTLSVDCKHWRKAHSHSSLKRFAAKQLARTRSLRRNIRDARPIASVILSFSESAGSFVDGVAIVPLRTLRSFLTSVESYSDLLQLV